MHISQFHYLPLAPGFFTILVVLFIGMVLIFAVLGALRHAYLSLGVTPRTAMLLLVGSLVGSYFNIPIAALPPEQVQSDKVIEFFGMQYNVPVVENLSGTVIAINVGGAVIPTIMSLYLLVSRGLWVPGAIARLPRIFALLHPGHAFLLAVVPTVRLSGRLGRSLDFQTEVYGHRLAQNIEYRAVRVDRVLQFGEISGRRTAFQIDDAPDLVEASADTVFNREEAAQIE